jgi:proline racemase
MAVLHARGELGIGEEFVQQGPLDTTFRCRLLEKAEVGGYSAVIPEISGQAWITGYSEYVLDPTDPFPAGYRVGDLW